MKLILEAYDPSQIFGVINDGTTFYIARPPFKQLSDCEKLTDEDPVATAVCKNDYLASGREFDDFESLIKYLREESDIWQHNAESYETKRATTITS